MFCPAKQLAFPRLQPDEFTMTEFNARIEYLETQRNKALTDAVIKHGQIALANERIAQLEQHIQDLNAKLAELENGRTDPDAT